MRLLFTYIAIPILVLAIFFVPFRGLIILGVMCHLRPEIWGASNWLRPIFIFTLATAFSCILRCLKNEGITFPTNLKILCLWLLAIYISSLHAVVSKSAAFDKVYTVFKLLILMFLIAKLADSTKKIDILFWSLIAGILWVTKSAYYEYLVLGYVRANPLGGPGGGSNALSTALVMTLPFLVYKFTQKTKIYKYGSLLLIGIWIGGIIFCASRGAFIALTICIALLIIKSKKKIKTTIFVSLLMILLLIFAPQYYWQRMRTILTYHEDVSAVSRLVLWKAGIKIFNDYPIYGVGPGNFALVVPAYTQSTPFAGEMLEAHNTFIQLLAEGGMQSLLLYMIAILTTLLSLRKIRKKKLNSKHYEDIYILSNSLEIGIIVFLIRSLTGTTIYKELLYWFLGLSSALIEVTNKLETYEDSYFSND